MSVALFITIINVGEKYSTEGELLAGGNESLVH